MAKPRVFIGSSVEGLPVAYAVQQNLLHDAESTVWDQGVFDLSSTTIESLTKMLHDSDFAIFVFSADDMLKIRKTESLSVRDNVMFEFGLFVGRLGRERVFFLLPQNEVFHLPTDLLGITGGKYETNRSDGSVQAATGPATNQIRTQMKALGVVPGRITGQSSSEGAVEKNEPRSWIQDYVEENYSAAKATLQAELSGQVGDQLTENLAWVLLCEVSEKGDGNTLKLEEMAQKHEDNAPIVLHLASLIRMAGNPKRAEVLLTAAKLKFPTDATVARALARYHSEASDDTRAIEELQRFGFEEFPDLALDLADALEREEKLVDAIWVIRRCYARHPSHKLLRYKYARLALQLNDREIALSLLATLCEENGKTSEYWGYLGNACFGLELFDSALSAYKRAIKEGAGDQSDAWVISNIANLMLRCDLPSEAREYLAKSLGLDKNSDYAHARMAEAIKAESAEVKKLAKLRAEGRRQILSAENSLSSLNGLAKFAFIEESTPQQV
uniref:TPR repeat-containing protein n=1 Tax=Variovorax paradoxus (strain S110) TaxID=543728 RepID=C5CLS5_VARPS